MTVSREEQLVIWMIAKHPPPTPPCFDDIEQWQEYLRLMHESGDEITRRQDTAKWTTVDGKKVRVSRQVERIFKNIPICQDCRIGSPEQQRIKATGRCNPNWMDGHES